MSQSEQTGKVPGVTLLSTIAELRGRIEQIHQPSPQRLTLAKAYLDSLNWGINGLAAMGQRIGFALLAEAPPREFPKMLYRGSEYAIAETAAQEQQMNSDGFWQKVPPVAEPPKEQKAPEAPTISIRLPAA